MNYGRYGRELLLELKRGDDACQSHNDTVCSRPLVPAYNDELVGNALQDLKLHVQALQDQAQANNNNSKPSMNVRPSLLLQNAAIHRNKRCLLAYHVARINRIKPMYWNQLDEQQQQASNSASNNNNNSSKMLCPAEQQFLSAYGTLVQQYTKATGLQPDDLRAHGMAVPVSGDRVQVRVLKPIGGDQQQEQQGIVLVSGASVVFAVGSTHFLLWGDIEEYVRLGYLQVLDGEEQVG